MALIDHILRAKGPLNRRDAKYLEKQKQMVTMRERDLMKPAQIAKQLRVSVQEVYRAVDKFKQGMERVGLRSQGKYILGEVKPPASKPILDCEQMVERTGEYLLSHGLFGLKKKQIKEHLHSTMHGSKLPNKDEIGVMLRQEFKLAYRKYDGATTHYTDPAFDEKRLWVSRLAAQFMADGTLLISVDESHLRSDKAKSYVWQFVGNDRQFRHIGRND